MRTTRHGPGDEISPDERGPEPGYCDGCGEAWCPVCAPCENGHTGSMGRVDMRLPDLHEDQTHRCEAWMHCPACETEDWCCQYPGGVCGDCGGKVYDGCVKEDEGNV